MEMKKLSFRFIMACIVMLLMSVTAKAEMYNVSTAEEFIEHWKANHDICVVADIDLSSFDEEDMCKKYTGELWSKRDFDGDMYYTLSNIPEMMAVEMEGAKIHEIRFKKCTPDWDNNPLLSNYGTALLARKSKNCRFWDIYLSEITINGDGFEDASSYGATLVCHDEGSSFTKISATGCKVWCDGPYAGTLVGEADGSTFEQCNVNLGCAIYAEGGAINSKAGGLVGTTTYCTFTDCNSMALVMGPEDGLGGIVGYSINTNFTRCNNYGSVKHGSFVKFENFNSTVSAIHEMVPSDFSSDELDKLRNDPTLDQEFLSKISSAMSGSSIGVGFWMNQAADQAYYQGIQNLVNNSIHKDWYNFKYELNFDIHPGENISEVNYYERMFNSGIGGADDLQAFRQLKAAHTHVQGNVMKAFGVIMVIYTIAKIAYDAQDSDESGGIVGRMEGGSANACCNYGYVFSADAYAGGIAGIATDGATIKNCLNHGCVKGYEQTGGIVGDFEGSKLSTCLNVGNVSSGNSSSTTFGRIYGDKSSSASISHNYYSSDRYDESNSTSAGVTQQMLVSGQTTLLLNQYEESTTEDRIWRQTLEFDHYPTLKPLSDVVTEARGDISPVVRTQYAVNFIQAIANQYSDIVLTGDIELNTSLANYSSTLMPFVGSIDGQNHQLKNMRFICTTMNKGGLFNNDNECKNVGLLSAARGATFKDLELCDFSITTTSLAKNVGLLVGNSANCTYDNIRITGGSGITPSATIGESGGLVGLSDHDTFTDCSTGPVCKFTATTGIIIEDANIGGLVGKATGSSFLRCINRAEVSTDDDTAGGIVGSSEDCTLEHCLNMGAISGCEYLGGIVGFAEDTEIHRCANTGLITCTAKAQESEVGGIVGRFEQDDANKALYECANWGDVHCSAGENQGAIYGDTSGSPSVHDNYYCFVTEDNDHPAGCVDQNKVLSGEWAATYNADYDKHQGYYYQDIDRNSFGTHYPVPVAAAGEITKNWDCKNQKFSYSNLYNAGEDHTTDANKFGLCRTCGSVCAVPAYYVNIDNSQDMVELARALSRGQNFSNNVLTLTSDIDFKDCTTPFLGIGTTEHPYKGVFNGNCHTIKNLVMEPVSTVPGLFSTVSDWADIHDVIMDSTCVLRSAGWGAGGIVGCTRGSTDLHLTNCGFEGFVSGYKNVGSMLGGTFSTEGATISISISYCYNTGTVKGDTESASLCGYAGGATVILYSWNAGNVTGYSEDAPIIRGNCDIMRCCYDINASNDDNHITAEDVTSGQLAFYLNESISGWGSESAHEGAWYQQVGVEEHPSFIRNAGHTVYHHYYRWCDERETIIDYYDNEIIPIEESAIIKHDFDENGICLRKAGEVHGEECPRNDDWWSVTKIGHLYYIAEQVRIGEDQHNIDMQADLADNYFVFKNGALSADTEGFRQWIPIGTDEFPFKKKFAGNNHVVSGLYMDPTEHTSVAGLFGVVQGNASISNVGVTESYFGNAAYGGSIAAVAIADEENIAKEEFPHISNCYASYGVIDKVTEGGGILGRYFVKGDALTNFTTPICDCYNTSMVTPEKKYVCPVCGWNIRNNQYFH